MANHELISTQQARRLALNSQGLNKNFAFGKGKNGTLKAIKQIGYIQIDTISVVERAHNHTLYTRVPNFQRKHLHDLQQKERKVFEYWSHAAAFLPMDHFRFTQIAMKKWRDDPEHWFRSEKKLRKLILKRIREEGPLRSKDFEHKKEGESGWWNWKPAKRELERMFFEGVLMVSHREGFQKVLDLAERVLPSDLDVSFPTESELLDHLIFTSIKAHGFSADHEISYLRKGMKAKIFKRLKELEENGDLQSIKLQGEGSTTYFAKANSLKEAGKSRINKTVRILSPFDNLIIQRKRTSALFNFDYTIECYVPKPKRKYGYFVLPVLFGDQFAARIDAKIHRKENRLEIFNLVFEPGFEKNERFRFGLDQALDDYKAFCLSSS